MHKITESRLRQIISEEITSFVRESSEEKPKEVSIAKKATGVIQGLFNLKKTLDELEPEAYGVVTQQVDDLKKALDVHLSPVMDLVAGPKVKSPKFSGPQDLHMPPSEEEDDEEDDFSDLDSEYSDEEDDEDDFDDSDNEDDEEEDEEDDSSF